MYNESEISNLASKRREDALNLSTHSPSSTPQQGAMCLASEGNEAATSTAPSRKSVVAAYAMVFSLACAYAAQSINFVPSNVVTYIAIAAALPLSLTQTIAIRKPGNSDGARHLRHLGLFFILCLSNFWMFAITWPSLLSSHQAIETREVRTLLDVRKSRSPFKCAYSVVLENLSPPLRSKTCVSQNDWKMAKKGEKVTVVLSSSGLGQAVKGLEPADFSAP